MFNIKDIVKYKTPMNPRRNWGIITDILEVKSSVHERYRGVTFFRIQPLEDNSLSYYDATEEDILESYSKYFGKETAVTL